MGRQNRFIAFSLLHHKSRFAIGYFSHLLAWTANAGTTHLSRFLLYLLVCPKLLVQDNESRNRKEGLDMQSLFINSDEAVTSSHWTGFSLATFWLKVIGLKCRFFSLSLVFLAKTSLLWFKLVNIG